MTNLKLFSTEPAPLKTRPVVKGQKPFIGVCIYGNVELLMEMFIFT